MFVDSSQLTPLPVQPNGVPWPTQEWPTGESSTPRLVELAEEMVTDTDRYGTTYAQVIIEGGRLVHEYYGGEIEHWDRPNEPVTAATNLLSWSMAKSFTHAAVGIAVGEGLLDLAAPAPVPEWADDDRSRITLDDLLCMRDGLEFWEDYEHGLEAHVVEMLFGSGQHDVAGFAVSRPAAHPPGEVFNYSSGTTNIISRILGEALGGQAATEDFFRTRLFDPIGMTSAELRFDDAGTFIASSYLYATARDFARFGLLYLRDGVWDGRRILPEGWVDHGRLHRSIEPTTGRRYGAQWWVVGDDHGSFWANGYDGQSIMVVPESELVVVRLGKTSTELSDNLHEWRLAMIDAAKDR